MDRTKSHRSGREWFRAICAGAAMLAGVALCPLTPWAQVTGTVFTTGPVLSFGNQFTYKVWNSGGDPLKVSCALLDANGNMIFGEQVIVPPLNIVDVVAPTVP